MQSNERIVRKFWRLNQTCDFARAASMMAATASIDWVLTRERIPSPQNWQVIQEHYPGTWCISVKQVISQGTSCVTIADVRNDTHAETPISFFTIEDGRITKLIEYWPQPEQAADWRRQWTVPLEDGDENR